MTHRPPPPRRSSQVQPEKPAPPAVPAEGPAPEEGPPPPAAVPRLHWGWRLALFLWATSFIFLLLYDVLAGVFRGWRWLF